MKLQRFLNDTLKAVNVKVRFTKAAYKDLASYDKGEQRKIIASIIRRGQSGPLLMPDGLGEPLRGKLSGFTKIKLNKLGIRIIYKPTTNSLILMGIIVIGPRRNKKVYSLAINRLKQYSIEISD